MISLINIAKQILTEKMTFSQLFNRSEAGRKDRAKGMRVTRLPVLSSRNGEYWNFQYQSAPNNNTSGGSWKGRITFRKTNKTTTADNLPCFVDCGCQDYKYRWAYANSQKEAGPVGPNSLNKSNGSPAPIMNPRGQVGLCKHLIALKTDLHKKLESNKNSNLEEKLNEVVDANPSFEIEVLD